MSNQRVPRQEYCSEPHDLWSAFLFFAFALFSLVWPNTGMVGLFGASIPRGYCVALILGLSGTGALLFGLWDFSKAPKLMRLIRCFYPQAYFGPLFGEAILLSSQPWGGPCHDGFFALIDGAVFGVQPSETLYHSFGQYPWCNELMFAAYFSFYLIMVLTPWIPWLRGDEEEGEREASILAGFMCIVYIFYVFFRVVGPKHWLPGLVGQGYGGVPGGLFTLVEGRLLDDAVTTGAAFPSSHVAVSLMMTIFVAKTARKLLPLYLVDLALIMVATVYLHAHWAADVAGGLIVAAILMPTLDRIRTVADISARRYTKSHASPCD
jgi:membrane-associated phospholipid phosphatase